MSSGCCPARTGRSWPVVKDLFAIGVPSGVQGVFRNGSRLFVLGIVTSTEAGTYGAAALTIGFQVESLVFMPGLALSVAATSLVGQSLGAWQPQEARLRGNMTMAFGLVVLTALAIPIVIFAPAIIRLFDPSAHPVLLETGTTYFRINTVVLPLVSVAMVANGIAARRRRHGARPDQHDLDAGADHGDAGLCAGHRAGHGLERRVDCAGRGHRAGCDDHGVALARERLAASGPAADGALPRSICTHCRWRCSSDICTRCARRSWPSRTHASRSMRRA